MFCLSILLNTSTIMLDPALILFAGSFLFMLVFILKIVGRKPKYKQQYASNATPKNSSFGSFFLLVCLIVMLSSNFKNGKYPTGSPKQSEVVFKKEIVQNLKE